ncbi:hypothetical protein PCA31118_00043 [Pandoraea captiosa]|uniref:Uncharacterized protein n=1 Tax=Pandoraea captiosa TaxID=2508302 RepID=A0A5E4ZHS0_9BURK|nr:hypothetical protein [Pandoraea captiosa]VVE59870.1 hypothetical protein PCA31118_00043 [Pandoraea captiosa]
MANKRQRAETSSVDVRQLALNFEVFAVETPTGIVAVQGENRFDAAIRQALVVMLETAFQQGQSRDRVADQIGELLGRPVSKANLDLWTAPSQADRRIPVDALLAIMTVCQNVGPLEWMAHLFKRRLLTEDEALCAELGAMAVLDRHIKAKQKAIEGKMDEKVLGAVMHRIKKASPQ